MKIRFQLQVVCIAACLLITTLCWQVSATVIDKIVAIVNSDIITLVELNREAAPYVERIKAAGYSADEKQQMIREVHEKVLDALIDKALAHQEAQRYKITVSESEITEAMENFMTSKGISQADMETMLAQEGLTMEGYRETYKKQILQARLYNHAVKSKVVITEAEVMEEYKANEKDFAGVKKYHLRNILTDDEDLINQVYQKLKKSIRFSTLAKKYSIAPNAFDGGDLGLFDVSNFSEEIKTQIGNLKKGQFTQVIHTSQGFQIFYIEDIVVEGHKTFEQAHDEIYDKLYRKQVDIKVKTWLESLKKEAHIERKL